MQYPQGLCPECGLEVAVRPLHDRDAFVYITFLHGKPRHLREVEASGVTLPVEAATAQPGEATPRTQWGGRFGRRVASARVDLGLTQGQLGAMIGVSSQVIAKVERNRTRLDIEKLGGLATALEASVDWLLGNPE